MSSYGFTFDPISPFDPNSPFVLPADYETTGTKRPLRKVQRAERRELRRRQHSDRLIRRASRLNPSCLCNRKTVRRPKPTPTKPIYSYGVYEPDESDPGKWGKPVLHAAETRSVGPGGERMTKGEMKKALRSVGASRGDARRITRKRFAQQNPESGTIAAIAILAAAALFFTYGPR